MKTQRVVFATSLGQTVTVEVADVRADETNLVIAAKFMAQCLAMSDGENGPVLGEAWLGKVENLGKE